MHPATRFVLWTLGLSWSLGAVYHLVGLKWSGLGAMLGGVVYMWVPALVAIALSRRVDHAPLSQTSGLRASFNLFWLWAALLPGLLAVATFGLGLCMPDTAYDSSSAALLDRFADMLTAEQRAEAIAKLDALPIPLFWLSLLQGIGMGATLNVPATLGEELGWRGYLTEALRPLGWARSSLIIGFVWGIWHAPLILLGHNYPHHPLPGVGMMVLFCMAVAPVMGWVRERAGSVWAAAIFHGALNGTAGVAIIHLRGGHELLVGVPGLAGILAYALTAVALAIGQARRPT